MTPAYLDKDDGRLNAYSMEDALSAVVRGEILSTLPVVNDVPIIASVARHLPKYAVGNGRARNRLLVQEELDGTVYHGLYRFWGTPWQASYRHWALKILYFDTDPVGEEQFSRALRNALIKGESN